LLELMLLKRSKKNTKCVSAANEELTAAKQKLMMLAKVKAVQDAAAGTVIRSVAQPVAPTTVEQKLARKNELKARG
nr:hypothetical protein [Tanacetum cinerariifolium]